MIQEKWKYIGANEKMRIVNGTALTFAAIILYFVAFIISLTIHYEIVSAGATMLGAGLAYFGIMSFVKNQMTHFETTIDERVKKLENKDINNTKDEQL